MDISKFMERLAADPVYLVAQILGVIAVIFTFLSYQGKTQRKLIIVQSIATVVFSVHYLMLGAIAGAVLNLVCIGRNFIYCNRQIKLFASKYVPYGLALLIGALGALSWQGIPTLLLIVALMINTVIMSMDDAQLLRKSILLTSSMILAYDIIIISVGGSINESIAIISSVIGIIRYRKALNDAKREI